MKIQTAIWFWPFLATCLFSYSSNKLGYRFPDLIQFYLSDLLAIPVVATLGLCLMKFLRQQKHYVLLKWQIVYVVITFCFAFELLLPLLMRRYTGDILDILMYFLGGLFFWKMMNK